MKISKKLTSRKEALHWLVKKFPKPLRHSTYRHLVRIKTTPPAGVHFKLATTQGEFTQAFSILHDAYVEAGLMKPDPSGLRITPYHLLPTTTTLIAKDSDTVIGTLSIIRNSLFGLPCENAFDLASLKASGRQIAEISALAIRPEWRGKIFLPLTKYLYEYCTRYFGLDTIIITTHSGWHEFYESIILFQKISEKSCENYSFSNNMPVVGEFLHFEEARWNWARHYAHRPETSDLFSYFTRLRFDSFEFPEREYFGCIDPAITPEILDHFFEVKPDLAQTLSPFQLSCLRDIYNEPAFKAVLDKRTGPRIAAIARRKREGIRIPSSFSGALHIDGQTLKAEILDVSPGGFKARFKGALPASLPNQCRASLQIGEFRSTQLEVQPVWSQPSGVIGFQVSATDERWERFLASLRDQILRHGDDSVPVSESQQKTA